MKLVGTKLTTAMRKRVVKVPMAKRLVRDVVAGDVVVKAREAIALRARPLRLPLR